MEEALRSAQRALEAGEVPVGAVVVCGERVVGRGWNRNITDSDPTAHAEIVALREAGTTLGNHRLTECDLFATIEPCPMCAGAIVHTRLARVVFGLGDPKGGAAGGALNLLQFPTLNHQCEITSGVRLDECRALLQSFFAEQRQAAKAKKNGVEPPA